MTMIRKQIYLDPDTNRRIKAEAKRRGISEAAALRNRLNNVEVIDRVAEFRPDPKARTAVLKRLRRVQEQAGKGPGTGWRLNREEIYADRLEKALGSRSSKQ